MANLKYVGELHEILELDYTGLCVIVLLCKWVKANYRGNTATMKKDKWGFTLVNFNSVLPFGPESFAFSMHIDQMYFADAREEPGWKVILCKEVRGQRVYGNHGVSKDRPLFAIGEDDDHEGLCAPEHVAKDNPRRVETGRVVCEEEAVLLDDWNLKDRDLGESGSSSDREQ